MTAIAAPAPRLVDHFESGLDAPICLTWELTYACNLACVHCLSSSGRRDPRELTTAECQGGHRRAPADAGLLRQHRRRRADGAAGLLGAARLRHRARRRREVLHQRLADHARDRRPPGRQRLRRRADLARRRDRRGQRRASAAPAPTPRRSARWSTWATPGFSGLQDLGRRHAPERRRSSTPSRRSPTATARSCGSPGCGRPGRGADVWDELHPTAAQQRQLYDWLLAHGEDVLTGDSFFHLAAYGEPLPGLNLCGAGRVVCLIDPVGDVYACPFAIHDAFLAGNVRSRGRLRDGVARVRAVPGAAQAADRRRVPVVLAVRRLPRRLHGGEVLHRAAAGRPGPGVRARARRVAARPARRRARSRAPAAGPLAPQAVAGPTGRATRARSPGCRSTRHERDR